MVKIVGMIKARHQLMSHQVTLPNGNGELMFKYT